MIVAKIIAIISVKYKYINYMQVKLHVQGSIPGGVAIECGSD